MLLVNRYDFERVMDFKSYRPFSALMYVRFVPKKSILIRKRTQAFKVPMFDIDDISKEAKRMLTTKSVNGRANLDMWRDVEKAIKELKNDIK